ncbi:hypothetical protein [Streptomyces sp. CS-7]|uniref:ATP-dependent DNA ligase n=1 Tax=Streptomyces sp. CS-7 TaxID=2906769 RepID=UPI0037D9ABBE
MPGSRAVSTVRPRQPRPLRTTSRGIVIPERQHRRWRGDSSRRDGNQTGERANQRFRGRFLLVRLQESTNLCASLFDVLHLDGRLLTKLPYAERRELLEGLGLAGPAWSTPAVIAGHGAQAWEMARDAGLEGLIAKRLTSRYEPGALPRTGVKIKVHRIADVVIGGWIPGRGRLTGLPGAVLVGMPHNGLLHYGAASEPAGAIPNAPASPNSSRPQPSTPAPSPKSRP